MMAVITSTNAFKQLSTVCFSAAFAFSIAERSAATTLTYSPQFDSASRYTTVISGNGDVADIYYPTVAATSSDNTTFPIALLLQGALVDKSFYSDYASLVARYGFVVVVPNHFRPFPTIPNAPPSLLPETSQVGAVLSQLTLENQQSTSPLFGKVDTQLLGLLGHSFGAAVGLSVIANQCLTFLCPTPFVRPPELKAGIFYGANLRDQITNEFIPIANDGIGIGLIQGDRDGVALPERAERTFDNIQTPPKLLATLLGANHFGITNINNPPGAVPDRNVPTLDQAVGVETIARWSGLFLRSSLLNDPVAFDYIYSSGDALDPNIQVASAAVPEPSTIAGILSFSLLSMGYKARRKNRERVDR